LTRSWGHRAIALKVSLTFAVVSGLWFFFSDQLLSAFVHDSKVVADLSTAKGWFYILVVSALLFLQIRSSVARMDRVHQEVVRHRERLLLFEFTVDKSTDLVLWLDTDDRVLYANQSAVCLLGYPQEELLTMSISDVEDGQGSDQREVWTQLRQRGSVLLNRTYRSKEGRTFPAEVTMDLIEFQGKAFACASIRNVSDRRRLEEQIRQAQKMESVGTLAAGVAHDFNNILTVIQGCSELLSLGLGDRSPHRTLVDQVQAAVQRASALIRRLLAFSRGEKPQLKRFSFNDLILKTGEFLARVIGDGVRIEYQLCAESTMVEADPGQWEQVFTNLAVNARDSMSGSGTLTVSTRAEEEFIILAIRDTGKGIPTEIQPRIFEPFFTTKKTENGTGLGLSTVYGIVDQHRGTIRVESPPPGADPRGAEFTIRLPRRSPGVTPSSALRPRP